MRHDAILRLISERCNRLIVIMSPAFFKSAANTFFMSYAQALGIGECRLRNRHSWGFLIGNSNRSEYLLENWSVYLYNDYSDKEIGERPCVSHCGQNNLIDSPFIPYHNNPK